jgi:hypothetical protein
VRVRCSAQHRLRGLCSARSRIAPLRICCTEAKVLDLIIENFVAYEFRIFDLTLMNGPGIGGTVRVMVGKD